MGMTIRRQLENADLGYSDTPILPDSGYHVHDGTRPQPPIVVAGEGTAPPGDAVVLFDGTDLSQWEKLDGKQAAWKVEHGYMEMVPRSGSIRTKAHFGDIQLHVEFASPTEVKGKSQGRGNSGVFLMGRYEIQVLDNYDNPTYADGTVGGIYGQYPPLVNAIRAPGEWNTFDIVWECPRFEGDELVEPPYVTVFLNGVVLHHRKALRGPTNHKVITPWEPHPPMGPVMLQDHKDLVRFRNIWVRNLGDYDEG
jgi:hypothetical protein